MHLEKGLVYLCTKYFLLPLLHFWNYNPSPNRQIISFISAKALLQTQLVGAEWYKVSKIVHCRISPTDQIEEEVKLQSYILSSLFFLFDFFAGEQCMKTLVKVSMKVQRITGALSRISV